MPVDSMPYERNLITKLAAYPKIIDVENSITIVDNLLFATRELIDKKEIGIFNIVNPGPIRHRDIMSLYKDIVNPDHKYELISLEELEKQGLVKTGRSNCILDTRKLERAGVHLRPAEEAVTQCLKEYAKQ